MKNHIAHIRQCLIFMQSTIEVPLNGMVAIKKDLREMEKESKILRSLVEELAVFVNDGMDEYYYECHKNEIDALITKVKEIVV